MAQAPSHALLEQSIDITPDGGDQWLQSVPARWAVALLSDQSGRPMQLLAMKNLREAVKHRMEQPQSATRRVNWSALVRRIHWRPVDSDFEADWVYLQAAEQFFPDAVGELVRWTQSWFVHVDPQAPFPHYTRTTELTDAPGFWIGPLGEKKLASRLIELLEDAFDLCRYHYILVQSPRGAACAYKEMGKCPAPCDGSISMDQYRRLVELSVIGLTRPQSLIDEHVQRMEQAAAERNFEAAAKIKVHIEQLRQLGQGHLRHARPLDQFAFVTVQPGPKPGLAKVFLILPGRVEPLICMLAEPRGLAEMIVQAAQAGQSELGRDSDAARRIGLAARHLFSTRKSRGVFIALADLTESALLAAYRSAAS